MMSEAYGRALARRVLLAAFVAVFVPWAATAAEAGTAGTATAPAAIDAPTAARAATNGVVVTWSSANRRFEAPGPEQASQLVRELQELLAGGLADRMGLQAGAPVAQRTASGLLKARVPASLIDLAVVRVGADGSFAPACTQAAAATRLTETQPPAPARPVER